MIAAEYIEVQDFNKADSILRQIIEDANINNKNALKGIKNINKKLLSKEDEEQEDSEAYKYNYDVYNLSGEKLTGFDGINHCSGFDNANYYSGFDDANYYSGFTAKDIEILK